MYNDYDNDFFGSKMRRAMEKQMRILCNESMDEFEPYEGPCMDAECGDERTYSMIRSILDCPEMEKCHPFLYSLDMENVNESDTEKINKLYDLGVQRGMIEKIPDEECDGDCQDCDCEDGELCGGPNDSLTDQPMIPQVAVQNNPTYSVMYQGTNANGYSSNGTFYSSATSEEEARNDCISKLGQNGYKNVIVMAVEPSSGIGNVGENPENDGSDQGDVQQCCEDDSEEYEKQETGNENENDEVSSKKKSETVTNQENPPQDSTEGNDSELVGSGETEGETDAQEEPNDDEDSEKSEGEKEEDGESEESKKLTPAEKEVLGDEYKTAFDGILEEMNLGKSVKEMSLKEKADFFTKLSEKWTKNDPVEFLKDEDQEKLWKKVIKVEDLDKKED